MSDELLNQDLDVEGHFRRRGANDDPAEDDENDFEAHNLRMD